MRISRRSLLRDSATLAGGLAALELAEETGRTEEKKSRALPTRLLGRTKERVTMLGIGVAPLGSDKTTFARANDSGRKREASNT